MFSVRSKFGAHSSWQNLCVYRSSHCSVLPQLHALAVVSSPTQPSSLFLPDSKRLPAIMLRMTVVVASLV